MDSRWLGPACGVGAVLLIFGSFVAAGSQPEAGAPVQEVTAFYTEHDAGQLAAASLMSLGALLFLIFASTIVGQLRSAEERSSWTTVCFGGGVLVATGLLIFAGLALALGDVAADLEPTSVQALHVLYEELLFPLTIGVAAFMLGAGIATLRTGALPGWSGWLAVVAGIVAAVPSHVLGGVLDHIGFGGFLGLALWTLLVSAVLARRRRPTPPRYAVPDGRWGSPSTADPADGPYHAKEPPCPSPSQSPCSARSARSAATASTSSSSATLPRSSRSARC